MPYGFWQILFKKNNMCEKINGYISNPTPRNNTNNPIKSQLSKTKGTLFCILGYWEFIGSICSICLLVVLQKGDMLTYSTLEPFSISPSGTSNLTAPLPSAAANSIPKDSTPRSLAG